MKLNKLVFIALVAIGVALLNVMAEVPTPAASAPPVAQETPTVDEFGREPVNIVLVAHGACSWDAFWCVVEQGNKDAARDLGVDLTIISPPEFDPERTAQDIDKALAAKPDGLGVTVTDGVLFEEPMLRAIESGVPVIAYNAADWRPPEERIPYLTYIGQDEYTGGLVAGRRMVEAYGGTRGVCVNQVPGHIGLDARCQGFADALAETGLESEVLAITNDPAESATIMEDYYTANPDVDLWLTLGPNGANPFYSFMKNAGLQAGDIYHATFDLGPEIAEKIKDGTTLLATDQQPYVQGYLVVQWLTWIKRYGIYPPTEVTATGPGITDKDNIDLIAKFAGTYR
ncbi:MAG: sugar ABC transporter substrate-binding protein [Anaerolineales bacterium]|nr:sugar ABC transporter substrate-binding protein [Anaerolineales bacterium]